MNRFLWGTCLALAMASLAGCSQPQQPASSSPTLSTTASPSHARYEPICIDDVCTADPNGHDAQIVRNLTGFNQVNEDQLNRNALLDFGNEQTKVEGDLVVWRSEVNETVYGKLFASNITRKSLWEVTSPNCYQTTVRFEIHDGKVAFGQRLVYPNGTRSAMDIYIWDSTTNERQRIDLGVSGDWSVFGWDGRWMLLDLITLDANNRGLWAYDLETNTKWQIWQVPPEAEYKDGKAEMAQGYDSVGSKAFIGYTIRDENRLEEVDMATRERRTLLTYQRFGFLGLSASREFVVWGTTAYVNETIGKFFVYALGNSTLSSVAWPGGRTYYSPEMAGHWVVLRWQEEDHETLSSFDLSSGNRHDYLESDQDRFLAPIGWSTDGIRMAASLYVQNEPFKHWGGNVYWRNLP